MDERFLILFRHGIAEEASGEMSDDERRLTEKGEQRMKRIGKGVAKLVPDLEQIYSSPLIRAVQTAEWISKGYPKPVKIRTIEELRPGSDPAALRAFLLGAQHANYMAVGHEPVLSNAMRALTGLHGSVELKKGGCYGLRVTGENAALEWMLAPRVMRRV
jgi:phosphohistidine phosphatase